MAKQDFLDNFRIARNLFFHPRVAADSTQADPQAIEQRIARAAIWLTPKSVKGFNADDLAELGLDRHRELQAAVRDFLDVAQQVPPNAPATPEQLGSATVAFAKMLQILVPYLRTPQDGDKVEEALKSVDFPSWVVNWDYELDSDEDGAPAVSVYLYADESTAPRKEFGRVASRMTTKIRGALSNTASAGSTRISLLQRIRANPTIKRPGRRWCAATARRFINGAASASFRRRMPRMSLKPC